MEQWLLLQLLVLTFHDRYGEIEVENNDRWITVKVSFVQLLRVEVSLFRSVIFSFYKIRSMIFPLGSVQLHPQFVFLLLMSPTII